MPRLFEKFNDEAKSIFDYDAAVQKLWEDHPATHKKILFIDLCGGADGKPCVVYPGDPERKEKIRRWCNNQTLIANTATSFANYFKNSCVLSDVGGMRIVFLYTQKHSHDLVDPKAHPAYETAYAFDHEIGHAIVPGGVPGDRNLAECVADAYALIRHFQRYGACSTVVDTVHHHRAFDMVFRARDYGSTHFTSPVTEEILKQRYNIDWQSLTPDETVQMAHKFAVENQLPSERLSPLCRSFSRFALKADKLNDELLRELAEMLLTADSPDTLKWGIMALKSQTDQLATHKEYWKSMLLKLEQRQQDIPLVKDQPVSNDNKLQRVMKKL